LLKSFIYDKPECRFFRYNGSCGKNKEMIMRIRLLILSIFMAAYAMTAEMSDKLIAAVLETGGTYTTIQSDGAQEDWADLMMYLSRQDMKNIAQVPLPSGVKFFGLAKSGKEIPLFLIKAKKSGDMLVEVDSKGNFAPEFKANIAYNELKRKGNVYRISFKVAEGETYALVLNKAPEKYGLYSITASYLK
jgi:hypothetical protein